MGIDASQMNQVVKDNMEVLSKIRGQIGKVIIGQKYMVDRILTGILAGGHILIEGVPGLAKTTIVKVLSKSLDLKFQRIQFTPDLLPADLIGTQIFLQKDGAFSTKKGPIFTNILLADEINRAPAKVQSALLEAMQEKQVTIGETTYKLDEPFFVLATQNPIEQEGTYPLPEAQVDRFMMKLKVSYPSIKEEKDIVKRINEINKYIPQPVAGLADIRKLQEVSDKIYVDDKIYDYILNIVFATREPGGYGIDISEWIEYGASPRASIYLLQCAKANAFLEERGYVIPMDVKTVCPDVMRHRIIVSYEAEAEDVTSDDVIKKILERVTVP